jgi:uncharacterized RDD family membrane protein YckC
LVAGRPFANDNGGVASQNPIDRVLGAIVPRAVDAIDIDEVIGQVDVDHVLSGVDIDAVLQRVDLQVLMERVDLNALLERVDLTALLQQVDLDTLLARVDVGALIAQLDINALAARLDVNALVAGVDVDGLVRRVDVGSLVGRVDVDALVQGVDVDDLVQRVDVDGLVQRVDVDGLIQRVDVDALVQRVDIDQLIAGVDVPALVERAHIDVIVSNASRGVVGRLLDVVRRQLVGVDLLMIGGVNRTFRRPREVDSVDGGTVTGRVAGGLSRLVAFFLDAGVISLSYGLAVSLGVFLVGLFSGNTVDVNHHAWWWLGGYVVFGFFYYWIGLTITGRSIGKGLVGLRVVRRGGAPMSPGRAAVRTIVYPFSFILGLGLIPIVTGKHRRALHDVAAGSVVLYDWGDRPAEMPAPITAWIQRQADDTQSPESAVAALVAVPDPGEPSSGEPAA